MTQTLKQKVISGVIWQGVSNGGKLLIGFIISVILARLLSPEDFGIIAIIEVLIAFVNVFINSGFPNALIQKKELEQEDCSSVFFLNLFMAAVIYLLLFATAPLVADFYNKAELTRYIRVLSISVLVSSFTQVQGTLLQRNMQFYIIFHISWIAMVVSGTIGIAMAFAGFGVWSLIAQLLVSNVITCVLQWLWGKWRPIAVLDFSRLRSLFSFGGKLFVSSLLNCLYQNLYPILMGKLFNLQTLSFYNWGKKPPALGVMLINSSFEKVLFPALSSLQDDREKMRNLMKRGLKSMLFVVVPCMAGLIVTAAPLVGIVFGEKWLPAIPYMQLISCSMILYPVHTVNLQLLNACGRSDVFLILEIIKKVQTLGIILLTYRYGPLVMTAGLTVTGILATVENAWMSKKLVNYSVWQQLADMVPLFAVAAFSGGTAWAVMLCFAGDWLKLISGGLVFGILYLGRAFLFRQIPPEIIEFLKNRIMKKKVAVK